MSLVLLDSLLSLSVTPINRKRQLSSLLLSDYLIILSFYALLAFTGIFAFQEINDLYTLNFKPKPGGTGQWDSLAGELGELLGKILEELRWGKILEELRRGNIQYEGT